MQKSVAKLRAVFHCKWGCISSHFNSLAFSEISLPFSVFTQFSDAYFPSYSMKKLYDVNPQYLGQSNFSLHPPDKILRSALGFLPKCTPETLFLIFFFAIAYQ